MFGSYLYKTHFTDHSSIITAIPMSNVDKTIDKTSLLKSINYNKFNSYLNNETGSFLYDKSDVNELIDLFYKKILLAIEKSSNLISARYKNELSKKVIKISLQDIF